MRIYPLLDFLDNDKKEQSIKRLINEFSCPKNPDVERFLKNKAIDFERTHNARTYLIVSNNGELLTYFSLSFKDVNIDNEKLSKSVVKKLDGFNKNAKTIRTFLIGQIGKNANVENNPIILQDIFDRVFEILLSARQIIGGRAVILECQPIDKLLDLYARHDFKQLAVVGDDEMKTLYRVL
ncbi:acetyltransferase [Moraxella nasicaprae]|uniref:Acetyltransferase n=1 Tax=Moraxella nasicaprae TaxID=2904122 RepID=A0ABY6F6I9_9GAMM|nr:acetyltransferase [Moraxella nasicaprae]UXZ05648.1 acetyltransferase [Moraxella nasicaprae]